MHILTILTPYTCTLGAAWGFDSIGDNTNTDIAGGQSRTPLDYDISTKPASTAILALHECRFNYTEDSPRLKVLTPLSLLSATCKNESGVTQGRWQALINTPLPQPPNYVRIDTDADDEFKKACTFCFCKNAEAAHPALWAESWDFASAGYKAQFRVEEDDSAPCTAQVQREPIEKTYKRDL